ncbi:MAG: LemA family protein [Tissierellia bacterium]|nr:LemA family protein [Tissierellia bacterium]
MKKSTGIILAVVIVLAIIFGTSYNSLTTAKEDVDGQWAQVENQLKRRADLIPNLTNTVKGYADHEKDTFTELAKARSGIENAKSVKDFEEANEQMDQAIRSLNVVVEDYPELKADESFKNLQINLEGTENRIATERMRYNEMVRDFNKKVKRMPTRIIASIMGFSPMDYFQISENEKDAPVVDFGK